MPLPRRSSPPRLDRSAAGLALLLAEGQLWLCGPDPDTGPIERPQRPAPAPAPTQPRRQRTQNRPPGRPSAPTGPGRGPAQREQQRRVRPRPDLKLPRHWRVDFQALDGANEGKVRISSPDARGVALVGRPHPDWVKQAITEIRFCAAEQGHAAWRGERTELDAATAIDDPTEPRQRRVANAEEVAARGKVISYAKGAVSRPDVADPTLWVPNADGTWTSPNGRTWQAKYCSRVIEKRRRLGLATSFEELHGPRGATG